VKPHETPSNTGQSVVAIHNHARGTYRKVFNQRKRRVGGLWERNGAFYAQFTVPDPTTGREEARRARLEDGNPDPTLAGMKTKNSLPTELIAPSRVARARSESVGITVASKNATVSAAWATPSHAGLWGVLIERQIR
jgi:hypothetical protein